MTLEADGLSPLDHLCSLKNQVYLPFLLGCTSSVSIKRSNNWLYRPGVSASTTRKHQPSDISSQAQGALDGALAQSNAANFPNSFTLRPNIFAPFSQSAISDTTSLRAHFQLSLSFLLTHSRPKQWEASLSRLPIAKALPTLCAPLCIPWPCPSSASGSQE